MTESENTFQGVEICAAGGDYALTLVRGVHIS